MRKRNIFFVTNFMKRIEFKKNQQLNQFLGVQFSSCKSSSMRPILDCLVSLHIPKVKKNKDESSIVAVYNENNKNEIKNILNLKIKDLIFNSRR